MKAGDLIKVKDCAAYGNIYMQQIAGYIALLINQDDLWMTILTQGKTWHVCLSDVEEM
jgi:hypothetical protein